MDILIVEDSATLRAGLKAMLGDMGHRLHFAESGEQCLHLLENCQDQCYDLVLMDVDMPGLDGFETTRLLRETLPDQWIPVIFVTGASDDDSYAQGIEAGGDDYLAKPVSAVILKAKIKALERIAEMQKELNRLNAELTLLSVKDSLTQLLNRRAFNEQAQQAWHDAKRQRQPCALAMFDADHFKTYNDSYGHMAGDSCLLAVASALQAVADNNQALLARYGGEEFIVFLPNCDQSAALHFAETARAAIEALGILHAFSPTGLVTASVGIAVTSSPENHSLDQLIASADKQLYRAKSGGRNQVSLEALDSHKTILIGLEDRHHLQALSAMLAALGNIVTADSGRECIEIADYINPDLIIIGSSLTDSNGFLASTSLRELPATLTTPILVVRHGQHQRGVEQSRRGINGYLSTPFDEDDIHQVVGEFITSPHLLRGC